VRKAVLDSSVLISGFLKPEGTCGELLDAAESGVFSLCLSHEIIAETADKLLGKTKLQRRYSYGPEHVEAFCAGLTATAEVVTDLHCERFVPDDPKDDMVVATAVRARADYLVTGDRKHLLSLGTCGSVQIVSPRQFLDLLRAGSTR
jgi:putative PIN family toxin of toxin-antitoxin system